MALIMQTSLTRLILAWDEKDGSFKGGDASWRDRVIDDATGEEVAVRERVAEPIEGALQPGTPLTEVLSATEVQRLEATATEKRRADDLQAEVDELKAAPPRERP